MAIENNNRKTRREFLIASAAIAGGLVSISLLKPFTASGKGNIAAKGDHQYGFGFDIAKCIGCGNCAKNCKIENDVPKEPFFFRTWVEQYTIKNDNSVKVESPNGGIDGFEQTVPDEDIFKSFFVPKACNHCSKAPCVQVCPVGATFVGPDGVVLVDEKYCIGCGYCVQGCPYGARFLHPVKHVADKCTLCYHRITKGMNPVCCEVCPTGARMFGDLTDRKGPLVKFIKEHTVGVLKPHLNTGSKLYYNALSEEVR